MTSFKLNPVALFLKVWGHCFFLRVYVHSPPVYADWTGVLEETRSTLTLPSVWSAYDFRTAAPLRRSKVPKTNWLRDQMLLRCWIVSLRSEALFYFGHAVYWLRSWRGIFALAGRTEHSLKIEGSISKLRNAQWYESYLIRLTARWLRGIRISSHFNAVAVDEPCERWNTISVVSHRWEKTKHIVSFLKRELQHLETKTHQPVCTWERK